MVDHVPALARATRRVLADDVLDKLRAVIVSGRLQAGDRLRENELADQLGLSRGPVREALVRLEQEGLVVLERHRGARVAALSREDCKKIYSVRRALEELAGEYACIHGKEEDFERTAGVLEAFARSTQNERTPAAAADWDIRFHDSVFVAAHNEPLNRVWSVLRSQVRYFLTTRMVLCPDFDETWEPEHRRLLNTLRERDATVYRQLIGEHVQVSYELLEEGRRVRALGEGRAGGPVNAVDGSVELAH
jgi:DNA-binding GntR family transcriptional regulator